MSINMNVFIVGGTLVDTPKKLNTPKGKVYAKFNLQQDQGFGQYTRKVCYEVTFFYKVDDIMNLKKGDSVIVTGKHEFRMWNGNPINAITGNDFDTIKMAQPDPEPEPEVQQEDWISDEEIEANKNEDGDTEAPKF